MSAKKSIIKDLRQEIADLKDKLKTQHKHMDYRERQFHRTKHSHEHELASINTWTNNMAEALRRNFTKELTWMELCDDSDSKFRTIKETISQLTFVASPLEKPDRG